jgi:hypothetical protein
MITKFFSPVNPFIPHQQKGSEVYVPLTAGIYDNIFSQTLCILYPNHPAGSFLKLIGNPFNGGFTRHLQTIVF